jgi:ribonuclease P protein component
LSRSAESAEDAENFGFGRHLRLLTPAQFDAVFSARRVLRGSRFALHYRLNGLTDPRLGFIIPKKQARSAVLRNAVKRQVRELFRLRRPGLPPMDLVLRLAQPLGPVKARVVIDDQAKADWRAEVAGLLDKLSRSGRKANA